MWPERLLRVAQSIKGMIDDAEMAAFYQLARLCEIHSLVDLRRYEGQYRGILRSLSDSSAKLMDVAVNLSTPLGEEIHSKMEAVRGEIGGVSSLIEATPPITEFLGEGGSTSIEGISSSLPSFDFVPLARVSDIGSLASRLNLALEEEKACEALRLAGVLGGLC